MNVTQGLVQLEGLGKLVEPSTFLLVALCINHYATACRTLIEKNSNVYSFSLLVICSDFPRSQAGLYQGSVKRTQSTAEYNNSREVSTFIPKEHVGQMGSVPVSYLED
jgi:hypothetical protein